MTASRFRVLSFQIILEVGLRMARVTCWPWAGEDYLLGHIEFGMFILKLDCLGGVNSECGDAGP